MKDTLRIPAFTAYSEPDHDGGARFSERRGVTKWKPGQRIVWYGKLAKTGRLEVEVSVAAKATQGARLLLTAGPVGKRVQRRSSDIVDGMARLGELQATPGYWRFVLDWTAGDAPDLDAMLLSGPAAEGAHFNLEERRNAASVHLGWPTEKGEDRAVLQRDYGA